jgi:hypothetical protein
MSLDKTDPVELYTPARIAEFLLGNATSSEEYAAAVAQVLRMGLDPDLIEHFRPAHFDANA